jgi:hypothetical protein
MNKPRITVAKVKEGSWRPRTFYWSYVDGEPVGKYKTRKEALTAAESRLKSVDEYWKSLGEEVLWEEGRRTSTE